VGVEVVARPGTPVDAGDVLAIAHASDAWMAARAVEMLQGAFRMAD
jgi:thymidine phosphorylase